MCFTLAAIELKIMFKQVLFCFEKYSLNTPVNKLRVTNIYNHNRKEWQQIVLRGIQSITLKQIKTITIFVNMTFFMQI